MQTKAVTHFGGFNFIWTIRNSYFRAPFEIWVNDICTSRKRTRTFSFELWKMLRISTIKYIFLCHSSLVFSSNLELFISSVCFSQRSKIECLRTKVRLVLFFFTCNISMHLNEIFVWRCYTQKKFRTSLTFVLGQSIDSDLNEFSLWTWDESEVRMRKKSKMEIDLKTSFAYFSSSSQN